MPEIVVETPGMLIAQESASGGVRAPFVIGAPEPPMPFLESPAMPLLRDREHFLFEGAVARVERVDGHLDGVEFEAPVEHVEMDRRVCVAGKTDKADLALLLGSGESLEDAIWLVALLWIVVVDDLVDLPDGERIGLEAGQGFLEHARGHVPGPAVGADLGHDDGLAATAFEGGCRRARRSCRRGTPRVLSKEVDAIVESLGDHLIDFGLLCGVAEMVATHADVGDLEASRTEGTPADLEGWGGRAAVLAFEVLGRLVWAA